MRAQLSEPDREGKLWTCILHHLAVLHVFCVSDKPPDGHRCKDGNLTTALLPGTRIWVSGQKAACNSDLFSDCIILFCSTQEAGLCCVSAGVSFQLIRWALFSGPVHNPILQCGVWSSPNARSQLSPRYFQLKTQAEMLNRNIRRTTGIQMELLTFEMGATSSLLRI